MSKIIVGSVLSVTGFVSYATVYSLRPPSGFLEAVAMQASGRQYFIQEPFYGPSLAGSLLLVLVGLTFLVVGLLERGKAQVRAP